MTTDKHVENLNLKNLGGEIRAARELLQNILGAPYNNLTSYFCAQQKILSMRQRIVELENELFDYRMEE